MKLRYLTPLVLALGLTTGCIEIKVAKGGCDCNGKHEEYEDKDERGSKHEGKEKDEKGEHKKKKEKDEKGEENEDAEKKESKESEAQLRAEAKISEADARQTATATVPNGTIKEGELERENGHLQWSFDMATPGAKDITEVNVDAISGKVINVAKEAPESEQAEEKHEKDKD